MVRQLMSTVLLGSCVLGLSAPGIAQEGDLAAAIDAIQAVGPKGEGHREAAAAWKTLASAPGGQLPLILAGMQEDQPLAENWLRSAAETVAQRTVARGDALPLEALQAFVKDRQNAPRARRVAFELISRAAPDTGEAMIPTFLDDPSLELRRDAVAWALDRAAKADDPKGAYNKVLNSARDLDQIELATEKLEALDVQVDLPKHFGFVMQWWLVGPFDNKNKGGFDVAYGPESNADLKATYAGQDGEVKWTPHRTDDKFGKVDLNKALGKFKGAICYAYAEFEVADAQPAELRLGCVNANKIWLNGKLLTANHVYHANRSLDQYVGKGMLKKGKNVILLKVAQNEQTESWAQDWEFQLRVCDKYGTAIHALDPKLQTKFAKK